MASIGRIGRREDQAIAMGVLAMVIAVTLALAAHGINAVRVQSYFYNFKLLAITWVLLLAYSAARLLVRERPASPFAHLSDHLLKPTWRDRVRPHWLLLAAIVAFMPCFSAAKSALPLFNTYSWDATFIQLDQQLHGTDPWRLLQPLLGYPLVTSALSAAYHLWFLLIYAGSIFFACYMKDPVLRARYFLAFFSSWVLIGIVLSWTFASVGPCFVGPILDDPHYAEQARYLASADGRYPVLTLKVQELLLDWHRSGDHGFGHGISAMPSMHVALAFLFFLAVRKLSRRLGLLFGSFFVLILLGSVHLGYHYAVDGYVSILVVALLWCLAGKLAPRLVEPAMASPPQCRAATGGSAQPAFHHVAGAASAP